MSPNILFILFAIWSALMLWIGYKRGVDVGREDTSVAINSLSFRQAVKWIWLHEQKRHWKDIESIGADLDNLNDVTLPKEAVDLAGKVRFEV